MRALYIGIGIVKDKVMYRELHSTLNVKYYCYAYTV